MPDQTAPPIGAALRALAAVAQAPPATGGATTGSWRWTLRQRVYAVRDALLAEAPGPVGSDGDWLAARGGAAFGERNDLLLRLGTLGGRVLEDPDPVALRAAVARLLADVRHHVQQEG